MMNIDPSGYFVKEGWERVKDFFRGNRTSSNNSISERDSTTTGANQSLRNQPGLPWQNTNNRNGQMYLAAQEDLEASGALIPDLENIYSGDILARLGWEMTPPGAIGAIAGDFKNGNYGAAAFDTASLIIPPLKLAKGGKLAKAPVHHICTNKNCVSTARGGPWTPRFDEIFKKAGLDLDDTVNKVAIPGHKGPHPEAYHSYVYKELLSATRGLKAGSDAYRNAVTETLDRIKTEATTVNSQINRWLTKQ